MQNSSTGGASDTEVNELAVRPCRSPPTRVVMTVTPVAKQLNALRISEGSIIEKASLSFHSSHLRQQSGGSEKPARFVRRQPRPTRPMAFAVAQANHQLARPHRFRKEGRVDRRAVEPGHWAAIEPRSARCDDEIACLQHRIAQA